MKDTMKGLLLALVPSVVLIALITAAALYVIADYQPNNIDWSIDNLMSTAAWVGVITPFIGIIGIDMLLKKLGVKVDRRHKNHVRDEHGFMAAITGTSLFSWVLIMFPVGLLLFGVQYLTGQILH